MSLEEALSAVEQLVEQVSADLLAANDPSNLEKHSTALRDAAARFSYALEQSRPQGQPLPAPLQKRVDAILDTLALQRESLARLSVTVDRQVEGLLPPTSAPATYGDGRGATPNRPGVARIYKSAG